MEKTSLQLIQSLNERETKWGDFVEDTDYQGDDTREMWHLLADQAADTIEILTKEGNFYPGDYLRLEWRLTRRRDGTDTNDG